MLSARALTGTKNARARIIHPITIPLLAKIESHITRLPNGCWEWERKRRGSKYAVMEFDRRPRSVHRIMYTFAWGDIPDGLELDHICRNQYCVNPFHLEAVTHKTNMERGDFSSMIKAHCKRGHPMSGDNIYFRPGNGYRQCYACSWKRFD